ncbi:hypothetical protein BV898_01677 [Hypsibius exemplaris]|uniref:Chromo domain-containing protein n=1 Tax=Hypsibius exemplaris TaxID=2072580 RepID=A0A1W0XAS3_HYPEX|nr:hypothetical protein BV898_01677 [Hypsibius exemplaris]
MSNTFVGTIESLGESRLVRQICLRLIGFEDSVWVNEEDVAALGATGSTADYPAVLDSSHIGMEDLLFLGEPAPFGDGARSVKQLPSTGGNSGMRVGFENVSLRKNNLERRFDLHSLSTGSMSSSDCSSKSALSTATPSKNKGKLSKLQHRRQSSSDVKRRTGTQSEYKPKQTRDGYQRSALKGWECRAKRATSIGKMRGGSTKTAAHNESTRFAKSPAAAMPSVNGNVRRNLVGSTEFPIGSTESGRFDGIWSVRRNPVGSTEFGRFDGIRLIRRNSVGSTESVASADPDGLEDDDSVYEVERVLGSLKCGKDVYYLIKWVGYEESFNTWEGSWGLSAAREAVDDFITEHGKANAAEPKIMSPEGILIGFTISAQVGLEKQLHLNGSLTGVVLSAIPGGLFIGLVIAILFMPHHKPVWMAGSVQLCGIFSVLTVVALAGAGRSDSADLAGAGQSESADLAGNSSAVLLCDEGFLNGTIANATTKHPVDMSDKSAAFTVGFLLFLTGFTAALPVIVATDRIAISNGILVFLVSLGPFSGFLIGSSSSDYSDSAEAYVVGLIVFGMIVVGLIVETIPKGSINTQLTVAQDRLPGSNVIMKNFGRTVRQILRNPAFLCLSATLILDILLTTCYVFVLPRYLEVQFDIKPGIANIAVALGLLMPLGLGTLMVSAGGQYLRLTASQLRITALGSVGLSCFGYLIFVFLGCGGAEFDHERQLMVYQNPAKFVVENICNHKCDCFRAEHFFQPVCHAETHVTFASPCLAGCMRWDAKRQAFGDCHCVENQAKDDQLPAPTTWVTEGPCSRNCAISFAAFVFIGCLFHIHAGFPVTVIMGELPSLFIDNEWLVVAKRLLLLLVISLSVLPAFIVSGLFLDSNCLLWDADPSRLNNSPACAVHDGNRLRVQLHVTLLLGKMLLTGSYYLTFRYLSRPAQTTDNPEEESTVYYKSVLATSTLDLIAEADE